MRNILLTTVTALLLASCGVYKPYSRPEEVKTDGLYGTDIQAEAQPPSPPCIGANCSPTHACNPSSGEDWRITTTLTSHV